MICIRFSFAGKDFPGTGKNGFPFGNVVIDGGQGKVVSVLGEIVRISNQRKSPVQGFNHFRSPDAPVFVLIHIPKGGGIKFQALSGAAKSGPEFLIQRRNGFNILS